MNNRSSSAGFSLLEVVLALALFSITLAYTAHTVISLMVEHEAEQKQMRARSLLDEATVALTTLRDSDMDLLMPGTFYLDFKEGQWQLVNNQEPIDGIFERTVTITALPDDAVDMVTSVTYPLRTQLTTYTAHNTLQDLYESRGDASEVTVGVDSAFWTNDNTELQGVTLYNDADKDITLRDLTFVWEGGGGFYEIVINGITCFANTSPEITSSGTPVPVTVTIPAKSTISIDSVRFTTIIESPDTLLVSLSADDTSTKSFYLSLP